MKFSVIGPLDTVLRHTKKEWVREEGCQQDLFLLSQSRVSRVSYKFIPSSPLSGHLVGFLVTKYKWRLRSVTFFLEKCIQFSVLRCRIPEVDPGGRFWSRPTRGHTPYDSFVVSSNLNPVTPNADRFKWTNNRRSERVNNLFRRSYPCLSTLL